MKLTKLIPEIELLIGLIAMLLIGVIIGISGMYLHQQEKEKERAAAPKGYYYNPYNKQNEHICKDSTHAKCDGDCMCDGLECPRMRDYQIEVTQDGSFFYDGSRFVGFIPYSGTSSIDSLVNQDNQ